MGFRTTYLSDLIDDVKDADISYRKLHSLATISGITIPFFSITNKYKDVLAAIATEVQLTEADMLKYRYKPKLLSLDLYGTTELWYTILELNSIISTLEFDKYTLIVYHPSTIEDMINEILILEKIIQ